MKENQLLQKDLSTLKNKIYKHMTTISKNVYIHVLDEQVQQHSPHLIKMKPKDVTDTKYVEYSEKTNKKVLNLK